MRRFLLIDSFIDTEEYFDDADELEAALFGHIVGMAKIVRVLEEDCRAASVFEICDVSKEHSL